ncbi:uncharacterized protein B0H18DRAFT_968298 [Fomitopsis serialis]|uniref:uncharacterized protein n=1 Tax=Fomitopsis serialis TaxID=139415 RepID=UPI0020086E27|nr:uncharacterized protein B0H18DRAFT_968298 [Neoantrodia serialis]KAH9938678.1 hypothetical protein B0H18DRAFT_968298 [Neoantrodia serialis]
MLPPDSTILVTGGNGFIGGNMAHRLAASGRHRIRIADISRTGYLEPPAGAEVTIGNLCEPAFCETAVRGVKVVLHFAATMGGMGVIHAANDFTIYQENHRMTLNLLAAAVSEGVDLFFYASSACVYPDSLQGPDNEDVSLKEDDVCTQWPPSPQGLYGLEKLNTESILSQYSSRLNIRTARFHNIYGPGGSWVGGREKAPAAFLRKALALKRTDASLKDLEIWAILALIQSDCREVVNIGDDRSVTIRELADIAVHCAGINHADVRYHYVRDKPVGVASRNSNNDRVRRLLGWSPRTTLEEGMRRTGEWIADEMDKALRRLKQPARSDALRRYTTSQKVDLQADATTFAILLPITSRGSASPDDCLVNLARFARSLALTTADDVARLGVRYRVRIYLQLTMMTQNKAEQVLRQEGFAHISTIMCDHPHCARAAWRDGADYMTLMGDDVVLQDPPGCHPDIFVNQDGDPFLFQLYRRWGCSRMISPRVSNAVGGSDSARYRKVSAVGWTFGPLDNATTTVESWLREYHPHVERKLTVDVVIPCYRVNLAYMDKFLALRPSPTCTVMFIVIVDDPCSPNIAALMEKYAHRPDVRIRVNTQNLGASASRNRGLQESAAEWVLFLDDDVAPKDNILVETEKVIRENPRAAGFVGTALFPIADTIVTAAIHLAGVTYFWDIARKRADDCDLPWGVTANLIAKRNMEDNIEARFSFAHGGVGFCAAPEVVVTHPWWNKGQRSWWRFYMWGKGDGALVAMYPQFTYREAAPNSAELLVLCAVLTVGGCATSLLLCGATTAALQIALNGSPNVLHDLYRHGWRNADRTAALNMSVGGWRLTFIRMFSEYGRLVGVLERREYGAIGTAFDWFTNRAGDGPRREENMNRLQRVAIWVLILAMLYVA